MRCDCEFGYITDNRILSQWAALSSTVNDLPRYLFQVGIEINLVERRVSLGVGICSLLGNEVIIISQFAVRLTDRSNGSWKPANDLALFIQESPFRVQ